jgi:hypothetical protein
LRCGFQRTLRGRRHARRSPTRRPGQFASEHGSHDHRGNGDGKSGLPIPCQQETDRARTCRRQIADHRLWKTAPQVFSGSGDATTSSSATTSSLGSALSNRLRMP